MSDIVVAPEGLGPQLREAYARSGMDRGVPDPDTDLLAHWFPDEHPAFAVARKDGEIVGVSAYLHHRFALGTQDGRAAQAIDSFVFPEARGGGVFHRLAECYRDFSRDSRTDLIWGFPNENARRAWFGKQGWTPHGQLPYLIRPLRTGVVARRIGLPLDLPVMFARDRDLPPVTEAGDWADVAWDRLRPAIGCARVRDRHYLARRVFGIPGRYRTVVGGDASNPAYATSHIAHKHGGTLGYLMEAMGEPGALKDMLTSELARLRDQGAEAALAYAYPWSPNYRALRRAGFVPLPERLRPIRIWFGSFALNARSRTALDRRSWYLSYLDSDTV